MWLQSCDQSFLAILLKDAFDRCFLQLQVTPEPARTHAACVSLSLFTMSISNGTTRIPNLPPIATSAENSRPPSQDTRQPRQLVGFRQKGTPRLSAASLSDGAYMRTRVEVSSMTEVKSGKFSQALETEIRN
jgi:hypothetical protein